MKILSEAGPVLARYGYKKSGDSFWKSRDGFYRLVHFQKGGYGSYFFVNVGLHPIGLPMLYTGKLCLKEKPKEHECALRQRAEQVSDRADRYKGEIGYAEESGILCGLLVSIMPDIEGWMDRWGSYGAIMSAGYDEISGLFPAAPLVWEKQFWLLKTYCSLMAGDRDGAEKCFVEYRKRNSGMDFSQVDHYMENLMAAKEA